MFNRFTSLYFYQNVGYWKVQLHHFAFMFIKQSFSNWKMMCDSCNVYQNELLERVKGIEPSSTAWKAVVLPLNYTRI